MSSHRRHLFCHKSSSEGGGTESMLQELHCKIDDLAFSGPGNSLDMDDYHAWCIEKQDDDDGSGNVISQ